MKTAKEIGTIDAIVMADYVLKHYGPMSHLKLQKLLYYCEAYHLAYFETSLMKEDFEAWMHGPVCREVYLALKGESILYGDVSFEGSYNPDDVLKEKLTSSQMEVIENVLGEMSTWTGMELETATHNETPWLTARTGYSPSARCTEKISKELMKQYHWAEVNETKE